MNMSRILKNVDETVDHRSGEIITTHKRFAVPAKNSGEFYMTFVQVMAPLVKLKSVIDIQVLINLCVLMQYNKNVVVLNAGIRTDICKEIGINNSNLSRSLKHLQELGLIVGGNNTYTINEVFFWKGTTDERDRVIKERGISVTLNIGGPDGDNR